LISSKPIEDDFIKTEDEKVYETNLLFDPNKNSYTDDISDNQNIQLQLETELLSDVTSNFSITFNNSQLMNFISNSTIDIIKKKDSSEFDDKNKDLIIGENMKVLNEELNRINSDLLKLNEMNEIQKNKKKKDIYLENQYEIEVIIYFSRQFEALRITYCSSYEETLFSVKY
jgi:hypothetical protein